MVCEYCGSRLTDMPENGSCPNCGGKLTVRDAVQQPAAPVCPVCKQSDLQFRRRGYRWWLGLLWNGVLMLLLIPIAPRLTWLQVLFGVVPVMGVGFLLPLKGRNRIYGRCSSCGHQWYVQL